MNPPRRLVRFPRRQGRALPRLRPRSLRGKLTLANVTLLGGGLLLTALASLLGIYTVLIGDIDEHLDGTRSSIEDAPFSTPALQGLCALAERMYQGASGGASVTEGFDQSSYVVFDKDGKVARVCTQGGSQTSAGRATLARAVSHPKDLAESGEAATAQADGSVFRVVAARLDDGGIVVVGVPLNGVRATVAKVVVVETIVGLGLLALLAALSMAVARRRLRPLEAMVETASAIAEGDLSRRVGVDSGSSEVEQLRTALNTMLHQIESAFQTREQASAKLRHFVADASHELRTPLASIRGYLQLYEKRMLSEEEVERALARVSAEAERMNRLVDELLALARLEQGPARTVAPVDLVQLARDGAADLRAQQPRRPVHLTADGRAEVLGDEAQLRQVIGNLLSNIRTHTPEEAPALLRVSALPEGGAQLRIADCGPGMREEDAARVFDRFFRANPDRARKTGGSGLGMSIVQAVVEAHAGTVELETGPGEGLAVTVTLPAGGRPAPEGTEGAAARAVSGHDGAGQADAGPCAGLCGGLCGGEAGAGGPYPEAGGGTAGSGSGSISGPGTGSASRPGSGSASGPGTVEDQARGEASSTTVMSGGAPTRTGGPQKPAPRVT